MEDSKKADLLTKERSDLRKEIIEMEKAQYKLVFTFIVIVGSAMGLIFSKGIFTDQMMRSIIIFILSQIEFLLGVLGIILYRGIGVHAEYIKAIEFKINKLAGERISIWESEITGNFMYSPKSIQAWVGGLIGLIAVVVYIWLMVNSVYFLGTSKVVIITVIEVGIASVSFLFIGKETDKAYLHAKKIFE